MNKVYKLVWSKVRNCYVAVSEMAKSHTKAPKSGVIGKTLVAGVLACVISCGAVMPVMAADKDTVTSSKANTQKIYLLGQTAAGTDQAYFDDGIYATENAGELHATSLITGEINLLSKFRMGSFPSYSNDSYVTDDLIKFSDSSGNTLGAIQKIVTPNGTYGDGASEVRLVSYDNNSGTTKAYIGAGIDKKGNIYSYVPRTQTPSEMGYSVSSYTTGGKFNNQAVSAGFLYERFRADDSNGGVEVGKLASSFGGGVAIGNSNTGGDAAVAIGLKNRAYSSNGDGATTDDVSIALGGDNSASNRDIAIGGNNRFRTGSNTGTDNGLSIGFDNVISGNNNSIVGNGNTIAEIDSGWVKAHYNHIFGDNNIIGRKFTSQTGKQPQYNYVFGESNKIGNDTTVNTGGAKENFVVGKNNAVDGNYNIVFGSNTTIGGDAKNNVILTGTGSSSNTVTHSNSVALGKDAAIDNDNIVSVGNSSSKRRIVNVGKGTTANDASIVDQTGNQLALNGKKLQLNNVLGDKLNEVDLSSIAGASYTAGNGIAISSANAVSAKAGTNVTVTSDGISVLGGASVASGNTGLMTGANAYTELRPSNGTFIKLANTTKANLTALDNAAKDAIKGVTVEGNTLTYTKGDNTTGTVTLPKGATYTAGNNISIENDTVSAVGLVKYDGEDKSIATLEGTGKGTKLTNLAAATLSKTSKDAVIGNQLWTTNQNMEGLKVDINTNKDNISSLNTSMTNALESVSTLNTLVNTIDGLKADASLNNLTASGKQVIAAAAANAVQEYMAGSNKVVPLQKSMLSKSLVLDKAIGTDNAVVYDDEDATAITLEGEVGVGTKIANVAEGDVSAASMDAINGSQLYAVQQQFDTFQSSLSTNNTTIAAVQTDVNTMKANYLNMNSTVNTLKTQVETGFNVTIDGAKVKTVNPESNMIDFVAGENVSITNEGGSLKISFTGGAGGSDDAKANADASNVADHTADWGNAIGTGVVEAGNGELVTGGTVYDALEDTKSEMQDALDGKANKDDVYTKDETDTLLSDKADKTELDAKADISYVDDGLATKADKDSVYTKDETDGMLDGKADKDNVYTKDETDGLLDGKANIDASNIDKTAWAEALGTGIIEEGNGDMVTGGTVYEALKDVSGNDLIKAGTDIIEIGSKTKYDDMNAVSIAKSDGSGRALYGVLTDPTDDSSAANVGYVNAISQQVVQGVNAGYARLESKINKTGAGAAALANLHPVNDDGDTRWNIAAGFGRYHGESAGALGVFYKPADNVSLNLSSTIGNSDTMFGAGVSVAIDKPAASGLSKVKMAKVINIQAKKLDAAMNEIAILRQEIETLKAARK